jgi:4-hydroxy-4-methyl-2-oxoglutarate aldolase
MSTPRTPAADVRADLEALGAVLLVEALGSDAPWTTALRRVAGRGAVAGPAYTVSAPPGDNLAVHHAVGEIARGAVLVVATDRTPRPAIFGEVLATAASARGLAALVTDGAVRDVRALQRVAIPVFCETVAPTGPVRVDPGTRGGAVELCGLKIAAGDWIVADDDAIVAIAAGRLEQTLERARAVRRREIEVLRLVGAGASTLDAMRSVAANEGAAG